jgi:hypothetical protein
MLLLVEVLYMSVRLLFKSDFRILSEYRILSELLTSGYNNARKLVDILTSGIHR